MFARLSLTRCYHSTKGVFGFRPRPRATYEGVSAAVQEHRNRNSNVYRWIEAYRNHGHRIASIDPVHFRAPGEPETDAEKGTLPELDYTRYGLQATDRIDPAGLVHLPAGTATPPDTLRLDELDRVLRDMYCGTCSIELAFIESAAEREWLTERYEQLFAQPFDVSVRREIAELMLKSQAFDQFLAVKFPTVKRYGGEGAESMMAFYRELFRCAADADLRNIVIGMPHRGKLNVLTTLFGTRPAKIFRKFKGHPEFPSDARAMCDIASHFHTSTDISVGGKTFHLNMLHNPSHLEAVNPVSMGKTRAKQLALRDGPYGAAGDAPSKALNVQVHGDAAFPGQGINQECLMMAEVPHFEVNGTIHLVVNNQVGFTTPAARGRGTRYVTDLAKSIMAPIVHVNADDPEALTRVTQLAMDYRQRFGKDFFIDLNCFRRWGHNELDDPTMTNPLLYQVVHARDSIPDAYARRLIGAGVFDQDDVNAISKSYQNHLTAELQTHEQYEPERSYFERQWSGLQQPGDEVTVWNTGLDYRLLSHIGRESVRLPADFNVHPHLKKTHIDARLRRLAEGQRLDWATAETLAIGSLLYQGYNVRLSGEDVGRGTFSQRHAMLVDQGTNEIYIPLNGLSATDGVPELGRFELANSILSEEAVLGFEYGMAIDTPNSLVIWEAQFGDFFNGAQIIIDTFLVSGETKWMVCNGLVMLLPHGYDGAASEHSSCRVERFLQMTDSRESSPDGDDVNLQVINPSTPAQYFHALRRQMIRNYRKPLLVVAPKTLLRLSECVSTHAHFAPGTFFQPVLGDPEAGASVDPKRVRRVVLCSGKHYYTLQGERKARNVNDVALVRLESLCPFPVQAIRDELARYPNAREFVWSQEEHRNMGAWTFVQPRFENMCERRIHYRGRPEGATVAVGVSKWHVRELEDVIRTTFQ